MIPRFLPFLLTLVLSPHVASGATCLGSADPAIQAFERQIGIDPSSVAQSVAARLESKGALEPTQRAAYYAVLAEAWAALEDPDEVTAAVEAGLALVANQRDPIYISLVLFRSGNVLDEAGIRTELASVEALRAMQAPGSLADACLLARLGHLELQAGRLDQANLYATRAYQMSSGPERRRQRVFAADILSLIAREQKDHQQALAFNREVMEWDADREATFDLATSRFIRGTIFRDMGDHKSAIVELEAARSLTVSDPIGIAYNDVLLCLSHLELGAFSEARSHCDQAVPVLEEMNVTSPAKLAHQALAKIDLAEGAPAAALRRLDRVLDQEGRDLSGRQALSSFELRSRVHRQLGQHDKAYDDLLVYLERFKANTQEDRAREAAALRASYEMDRQVERNAALQRELDLGNERLQEQTARLRWTIAAAVAGIITIVLLTALLLTNKRQRLLLVRLAEQDDLTNLPNRRRSFEVAAEAFERARREGRPLTIGLIDLDHFKRINDRYGHATGDFVLQEFSRVGREHIRLTDTLGRWGGEEFLIVLPDTTLDVALGVIERIREAALRIEGGTLAEGLKVTLSAGLATNEWNPTTLDELIARADAALYEAKNSGRDVVRVAEPRAQRSFAAK